MKATSMTVAAAIVGLAAGMQSAAAQTIASTPLTADQKEWRYEVSVMETVLEGAAEHGAAVTRDRIQAVLPSQLLLAETPRVRGFRLAGYGVFFDVEMPSLDGTVDGSLLWSMQTLDQNDLGLQSALAALKAHVESANDPSLQQALRRVELQVAPMGSMDMTDPGPGVVAAPRLATGSAAATAPAAAEPAARSSDPHADPADPIETYHTEVMHALMDAMLEHSGPLAIGPDEWLTVAVRSNADRPRLSAAETDSRTIVARISGAGLRSFRSGEVSKEEALKRIELRVF